MPSGGPPRGLEFFLNFDGRWCLNDFEWFCLACASPLPLPLPHCVLSSLTVSLVWINLSLRLVGSRIVLLVFCLLFIFTDWLFGCFSSYLFGSLVNWSVGWFVTWSVRDWFSCCFVCFAARTFILLHLWFYRSICHHGKTEEPHLTETSRSKLTPMTLRRQRDNVSLLWKE